MIDSLVSFSKKVASKIVALRLDFSLAQNLFRKRFIKKNVAVATIVVYFCIFFKKSCVKNCRFAT
jgi:hypothetical protein